MTLEAVQTAKRPDEHVLRQVARVLVIPRKPVAQLIDMALVPLNDDVERFTTAGQARLHQRPIVAGRVRLRVLGPRVIGAVSRHAHLPIPRPDAGPEAIDRAVDTHLSFRPRPEGER